MHILTQYKWNAAKKIHPKESQPHFSGFYLMFLVSLVLQCMKLIYKIYFVYMIYFISQFMEF